MGESRCGVSYPTWEEAMHMLLEVVTVRKLDNEKNTSLLDR